MSSNILEIIPDLNLPDEIYQTNTHQVELSDKDVSVEFMAPTSGGDTYNLDLHDGICQTNTHLMDFLTRMYILNSRSQSAEMVLML